MSDPTPNVALLRQTLAYIEDHPEEWDQTRWHCGTAGCFFMHAAVLDGAEWSPGYWDLDPSRALMVVARDDDPVEQVRERSGRRYVSLSQRVDRILGLTWEQSLALSDPDNTLDDLREQIAALTGGAS